MTKFSGRPDHISHLIKHAIWSANNTKVLIIQFPDSMNRDARRAVSTSAAELTAQQTGFEVAFIGDYKDFLVFATDLLKRYHQVACPPIKRIRWSARGDEMQLNNSCKVFHTYDNSKAARSDFIVMSKDGDPPVDHSNLQIRQIYVEEESLTQVVHKAPVIL
jgi:hypothetical protein